MRTYENTNDKKDDLKLESKWSANYMEGVLFSFNEKYISCISNSILELYIIAEDRIQVYENFKMWDGEYILTEGRYRPYIVWNIKTNICIEFDNEKYKQIVLDNDIAFAITSEYTTEIWDIHLDKLIITIEGEYQKRNCEKYILTESENYKLLLWKKNSFKLIKTFENSDLCSDVQITENCKYLIVKNFSKNIFTYNAWSIKTGQYMKQLLRVSRLGRFNVKYKSSIYSISPNNKYLIIQIDDDYLMQYKVIHIKSGKNLLSFSRSSKTESQILFISDSKYIIYNTYYVIDSLARKIRYKIDIQNIKNGKLMQSFDNLKEYVLMDNDQIIIAMSPNGIIKQINIENGEVLKTIVALEGKVDKIKSSSNKNYIILYSSQNIVIFNLHTFQYFYILHNQGNIYNIETTKDFKELIIEKTPNGHSDKLFYLLKLDHENKNYHTTIVPSGKKRKKEIKIETIKDFGYRIDDLEDEDKWIYKLWEWAHENKISGNYLPKNKADLHLLTGLELWYLGISYLPSELFNLKGLTKFGIFRSDLKEVPQEIKNLSNLKKLSFMNCNLSSIPIEITHLSKLEHLKLESNRIDKLPKEIGLMTNLKILELRDNNLYDLPSEVLNLRNLEFLSIDGNPNLKLTEQQREWINTLES